MRSASIIVTPQNAHYRSGALLDAARWKTFVDLVFEKTGRRGRGHELAMDLWRNSAVLDDLAVAEFDLQQLRLRVVADGADPARIEAFAFHVLILSPNVAHNPATRIAAHRAGWRIGRRTAGQQGVGGPRIPASLPPAAQSPKARRPPLRRRRRSARSLAMEPRPDPAGAPTARRLARRSRRAGARAGHRGGSPACTFHRVAGGA